MFKNLCVYRLGEQELPAFAQLEAALQSQRFVPCGLTQMQSLGWVPPRGEAHAPLLESVQGQWLMRLQAEQRLVPSTVVQERAQEIADRMEAQTGRAPGKRQRKEIKEQALLELLPMAFTRNRQTWVWLSPRDRWLVVDASSPARADEVINVLTQALAGVALTLLHTQLSPAQAMSTWLATAEPPAGFVLDRECELKAADENRAVVRYARHALDTADVQQHVREGKVPTRLALTWQARVSFVLTESLQLKKLAFLDTDAAMSQGKHGAADEWDADVVLTTGELLPLLADLTLALGGETQEGWAAAGATATVPAACAPAPAAQEGSRVAPVAQVEQADQADQMPPWEA